jgi:hypothetical protein
MPDDDVVAMRNSRLEETLLEYTRKRSQGHQYEHASV